MSSRIFRHVLVVATLVTAAAANAQVTSIQGSIADGQQISLIGSNFGTKPNGAKPYAFFDFGRGQAAADANSRTAWGAPDMGVLDSSPVAPGSTRAWKYRIGTDRYDVYSGDGGNGTRFIPKPQGRDLYFFYRIYFNWNGTDAYAKQSDWNFKGFRIWGDTSNNNIYMPGYGQVSDASGSPRAYMEYTGTPGADVLYPSPDTVHGLRKNEWKVEELFLRQSSSTGVGDGLWRMASNGRSSGSIQNLVTSSSSYPSRLQNLYWHQDERVGFAAGDGKFFAYDVVYIDDSFARVVVTGNSTWNDGAETALEIQVPVAWSTNRIDIVLRKGALGSLSGKYAYVFNSSGNLVSQSGFSLGGGAPQPNPPSAVKAQ
jgi:hypothetical protein